MRLTEFIQLTQASRGSTEKVACLCGGLAAGRRAWSLALLLTLSMAAETAAQQDPQRPFGTPVVSASQITWQSAPDHRSLLTVSGPDGVWFQKRFAPGETPWIGLEDLESGSDGEVNYSLKRLSDIELEPMRRSVEAGQISETALRRAEAELGAEERTQFGGVYLLSGAFSEPALRGSEPRLESVDGGDPRKIPSSPGGGLHTKSTPLILTNEDLLISGTDVDFSLNDTNPSFPRAGNYSLSVDEAGQNDLAWQVGVNTTTGVYPFVIQNPNSSTSTSSNNALVIGGSGNIGLGTNIPGADLHILSATPTIRFEDGSGATRLWDIRADQSNFRIRDQGLDIMTLETLAPVSSFHLSRTGNIGFGTANPDASLEVEGVSGTSQILVDEQGADANVEIMFNLVCNCAPAFRMNNTTNGQVWFFRHTSGGDFSFDDPGSAGLEARIDSSGNLFLKGSLSQGSSRALKENLEAADGEKVLKALTKLDLYEWSYIDEGARHFGPMAEEFSAAYGLGGDRGKIAPSDMAGLALAAVKTLSERNSVLEREKSELEGRVRHLESLIDRVAALERRFE